VYTCDAAFTPFGSFLVRATGEPEAVEAPLRRKIKELEPLEAVYDVVPLEQRIAGTQTQSRLRTILLTTFATAAVALACLGVYGTLSYIVGLRRREVGLRMALGAVSRDIVAQFLGKALKVVAVACAAGLAVALLSSRALSGMLYEISPTDPATLTGVVLGVIGVAAIAALFPALGAARLDPNETLREE
jgi:putative ABC transport system permease protein